MGDKLETDAALLQLRGVVKIPPQPLWFPDSGSLKPNPGERKEAVRFVDNVEDSAVIGYATTKGISSKIMSFKAFSSEELVAYIMNPASIPLHKACIVQLLKGVIFPFNLPDISDLSIHPKLVRIILEWRLQNASYHELNAIITTLLQETATEMATRRESWYMNTGSDQMTLRSCGNFFKDVRVDAARTKKIRIAVTVKCTTTDQRDGRTCYLSVEAVMDEATNLKRRRVMDTVIKTILIWNCRGAATWGFATALDHLSVCHEPDYIFLLETRVILSVMRKILQPLGMEVLGWANPVGGAGWIALLGKCRANLNIKEAHTTSGWECTIELS